MIPHVSGDALVLHAMLALATLGGFASLLKWMVRDKLKGIQDSLDHLTETAESQDKRIRQLEIDFTSLRARLEARGCLGEVPVSLPPRC